MQLSLCNLLIICLPECREAGGTEIFLITILPISLAMSTTSTSNYHSVNSPEHFQELLSADLERVSVLYFYADWAEPCASMNQVVRALAEANPSVLFLQIEAEALPEVSESFEVDAVPYTILLRVRHNIRRGRSSC